MAGTLKLVGLGRWRPDDVAHALAARDRALAARPHPPKASIWWKSAIRGDETPFSTVIASAAQQTGARLNSWREITLLRDARLAMTL